jgi:hypothetical protein
MGIPGSRPGEGMINEKRWSRANKKAQKSVIGYSLLASKNGPRQTIVFHGQPAATF